MSLICVALMTLNYQVPYVAQVRSDLSVLAVPLQYLVDWPVRVIYWLTSSFTTQQDLLEENARLRARQLLLQAKVQKLVALEQDNARLRDLLTSSSHLDGKVLVAQLLSVDSDTYAQQVILDKGNNDSIYRGQPVLDARGVMGQVIAIGPMTSRVMLITDTRSAIPVQDNRNGVRAIAAGTGYSNRLTLLNVPDTTDIAVGDLMVTSGLGQRFPYGYPVGVVVSVQKNSGEGFARIILKPSAAIEQTRQVVLVWPPLSDAAKESLENPPVLTTAQEIPAQTDTNKNNDQDIKKKTKNKISDRAPAEVGEDE